MPRQPRAILDLFSQGRLPPADGWAGHGHAPTWILGSFAKILAVRQDERYGLLIRGDARFRRNS